MERAQQRPFFCSAMIFGAAAIASLTCGGAYAHRAAPQYTEKTLHAFCAWKNCKDGIGPFALVRDRSGNLYGVTLGLDDYARVFKHDPITRKYTVLYRFGAGYSYPSDPIVDTDGNLYGAMQNGGTHDDGVVYKLAYNGSSWTYSVLHAFAGADGRGPVGLTYAGKSAGAPWDGSSPLFGVGTVGGGSDNGVAYELTHSGSTWQETVIHDFTAGKYPNELTMDSAGNLFGTTQQGGKYGAGLMYKLAAGTWTQSVLWNFCHSEGCPDGDGPLGRLLIDAAGNVFGTTFGGGDTNKECPGNGGPGGCGVVFERPAAGGYQVIYKFMSYVDGANPKGSLIMDSAGNLLGAADGGANASGVVFELENAGGSWSESNLYAFCSKVNCADGDHPNTTIIQDAAGHIYGTAFGGGWGKHCGDLHSCGTLFRLTP